MTFTPTRSKDFFINVGTSILESTVDALQCYGLTVPSRVYVGFDRPPQDCCPELTGWLSNVRMWNGQFPDANQVSSIPCVWGYSFDFTIRIGRCYWDLDEKGHTLTNEEMQSKNGEMYSDASALYMGWLAQWRAGNVSELSQCDLITTGTMQPYRQGDCAGWEFTVTVGVF